MNGYLPSVPAARSTTSSCVVHFYRNVFSHVPNGKMAEIARMLKATRAQEDRAAAESEAKEIVTRLKALKLKGAAEVVEQKVAETLTYYAHPSTHRRQIRTNNPLERIIREVRRRTRVVGTFPDGKSALTLVAARLRHIASTRWGKRRYLVMETLLNPAKQEVAAGEPDRAPSPRKKKCERLVALPGVGYERSQASMMFLCRTSEEDAAWRNAALLRAGLNEFYSLEDSAKRDCKKHLP